MREGKLSSKELSQLIISKTTSHRNEVLLSAGIAEDCAAIKSDGIILLTSDPITGATKNSGKLAILISANDIASAGGEPFCCLLTIIATTDSTAEDVAVIMNEANEMAEKLNIDIVGGHTEFSDSVNRTIVSCTMLGKAENMITTNGAKVGDSIVVTKTVGIEATAILAYDFETKLKECGLTDKEIECAKKYFDDISVIKEGRIAVECGVNSMHDITEGGIYGAITELCEASQVGAEIDTKSIPLSDLTIKICNILNLEPYRLISSGSMIMTTSKPEILIEKLEKNGIRATVVGKIVDGNNVFADDNGVKIKLSVTPDELLKVKR